MLVQKPMMKEEEFGVRAGILVFEARFLRELDTTASLIRAAHGSWQSGIWSIVCGTIDVLFGLAA